MLWLKGITFTKEQKKQVSHHLSILVVPTSCIISLETFYLNIFPLNETQLHFKLQRNFLCFPSSQTADSCCFPALLALPALAVCLTCLGATTHPVLGGEKGDPLRFKPLIAPAGQTKQGLVGKRSWKAAELQGKSLTMHSQDPTCSGEMGVKPAVQSDSTNTCPAQWFSPGKSTELLKQLSQLPGQEHLTPGFMGVRVKWLSNSRLKEFHQKCWRTDLLPLPALPRETGRR